MERIHLSICVLLQILQFTAHTLVTNAATIQTSAKPWTTTQTSAKPFGPVHLTILGPGTVTVGVPCSFLCLAQCSPECNYMIGVNGQYGKGNEISFTLDQWVSSQVVTCKASNNATGHSTMTRKTIRILEGPVNVFITGPQNLTAGMRQQYLCGATCKPSCTYSWSIYGDTIPGSGNEVAFQAPLEATSGTLVCKATNSVSGLFVTAALRLTVTNNQPGMGERVEVLAAMVLACMITAFFTSIIAQ